MVQGRKRLNKLSDGEDYFLRAFDLVHGGVALLDKYLADFKVPEDQRRKMFMDLRDMFVKGAKDARRKKNKTAQ
jgi:hypothetical protein